MPLASCASVAARLGLCATLALHRSIRRPGCWIGIDARCPPSVATESNAAEGASFRADEGHSLDDAKSQTPEREDEFRRLGAVRRADET